MQAESCIWKKVVFTPYSSLPTKNIMLWRLKNVWILEEEKGTNVKAKGSVSRGFDQKAQNDEYYMSTCHKSHWESCQSWPCCHREHYFKISFFLIAGDGPDGKSSKAEGGGNETSDNKNNEEDNGIGDLENMLDNLDQFVLEPSPQGCLVKCRITRDRKGMDRGNYLFFLNYTSSNGQHSQPRMSLIATSIVQNQLIPCKQWHYSDSQSIPKKVDSSWQFLHCLELIIASRDR